MAKIPLVLEQYQCIGCEKKWYINTDDKLSDEMVCPYGCEINGKLIRKFNLLIKDYEDYAEPSLAPDIDGKGEVEDKEETKED